MRFVSWVGQVGGRVRQVYALPETKKQARLQGLVHHEFSVEWSYFDADVEERGTYKAVATFVPVETVVEWEFEVKFLL